MKNKVAVLYIVTGRYVCFWDEFYTSCEKFFLTDTEKTYFVFTDSEHLDFEKNVNIKKIHQEKLGWPYDTMLRFDIFLKQKELLKDYDYIFFFNANTKFLDTVGKEILPSAENDGLMTGSHPAFYNKQPDEFTYDRNPKSQAYIPYGQGKHYATGALNGGTSAEYLRMCEELSKLTHVDIENKVEPLWHDESMLNKYLLDKNPLIMPVNYLYPEGRWMPRKWYKNNPFKHDIKILSTDKAHPRFGGKYYLRGLTDKKMKMPNPLFSVSYEDTKKVLRFFGFKIFI